MRNLPIGTIYESSTNNVFFFILSFYFFPLMTISLDDHLNVYNKLKRLRSNWCLLIDDNNLMKLLEIIKETRKKVAE